MCCNNKRNRSKYNMVRDFHSAFSYPMADKPTPMDKEMVLNRLGFLAEEMIELLHVTSKTNLEFHDMYTELLDRMDVSFMKQAEKQRPDDVLVGQVDALIDIAYFNYGNFTVISIDPDIPFEIVQECNMSKLFPDGKPRYNEHGKIIKPDGWQPPEPQLEAEITRQIKESQN